MRLSVKQNINFLEQPTFVVSPKYYNTHEYTNNYGYILESRYKTPTFFDKKVLYFIIGVSQLYRSDELTFNSVSNVINIAGFSKSGKRLKRVQDSLVIWANVSFIFDCSYYSRGRYLTKKFSVLEYESTKANVKLNEEFMEQHSMYYEGINLPMIMGFKSGFTARLFELLRKSFYKSKSWSISYNKLINKTAIAPRDKYMLELFINKAIQEIKSLSPIYHRLNYTFSSNEVVHFEIQPKIVNGKHIFNSEVIAC